MEATITKRDTCSSKLEDLRREVAIENANENSLTESGDVTLKTLKKIHAKIRQLEESAQEKESVYELSLLFNFIAYHTVSIYFNIKYLKKL